jgi:glutathione S-transferase
MAGRGPQRPNSPEFLAMNPHGRVPVIDDDGTIVWESQTILRYLAAKYGRGRFWSDDPPPSAPQKRGCLSTISFQKSPPADRRSQRNAS